MPNQRNPNKKSLSFWIEAQTKERLEAFCKQENLTKSEAVSQILEAMLDELETKDRQNKKGEQSTQQTNQL